LWLFKCKTIREFDRPAGRAVHRCFLCFRATSSSVDDSTDCSSGVSDTAAAVSEHPANNIESKIRV
jgi:hypothetical protein